MHANSVEVTMKVAAVRAIKFNELFGTGSRYFQQSKEKVFYQDCLSLEKRIQYIPVKITSYVQGGMVSTWFRASTREYFIDKGAMYYRLHPVLFLFYIASFALRKFAKHKKETGMIPAVCYMLRGVEKYQAVVWQHSKQPGNKVGSVSKSMMLKDKDGKMMFYK